MNKEWTLVMAGTSNEKIENWTADSTGRTNKTDYERRELRRRGGGKAGMTAISDGVESLEQKSSR